MVDKCGIPLILRGQLQAECEKDKGHKGRRHKGKSYIPIYQEFEWTLKKNAKFNFFE